MNSRRNCIFALALALFNCGCASFWYEFQPKRLKKWNSGDAPSLNPEFTYRSPSLRTGLARRDWSAKPAALTANSAEVSFARAQNQD